ncbi:MAG TPA: ABC transporter permease [Acidimicrobiia bacterium]|jgi:ABC-2 type transport system permease protein
MSAIVTIVTMTFRQVLGVRRMIGLALLALAPAAIFLLSPGRIDPFVGVTIGLLFSVAVPVITLILASTVLGEERREGTLSFIVLRPIPRVSIAFAKLVAAVGSAFVLTGVGALAMAMVMGIRTDEFGYVVPFLVGSLVATLAYAGVFVPLGYVTERATIVGLAFVFIWESAVAGTIPGLAATSPWRIGFGALVGLAPDEFGAAVPDFALGTMQPGAGGAAVRVLVVIALALWLTTTILRKRDLA